MSSRLQRAWPFWMMLIAVGCRYVSVDVTSNETAEGDGDTDADTSGDTDADTDADDEACPLNSSYATVCDAVADGTVVLDDSQNYALQSTLTASRVGVQGNTNLLFEWGDLSRDMRGRPLDPVNDVDMVVMTFWALGPDELMRDINDDQIHQADMGAVVMSYTENDIVSENLLNFTLFDNPVTEGDIMPYFNVDDPNYYPTQFTHMVMATTGEVLGENTRMIQLFYLDPASSETTVRITDDSATLDYSVDLRSLEPLGITPGPGGLVSVDWVDLTEDARGGEFNPVQMTRAIIAHFETMNLCDMEARFPELDAIADDWYSAAVEVGTTISFEEFATEDGIPFQGIDDTGVWVLGLYCVSHIIPTPQFMTVLHPCG